MTAHLHVLQACAPAPLANYLKALGILRLVAEQADKHARGWWDGDRFCLLTRLSKEELEAFFLERYEPTPIFNPWGARSGYYPGSPEKTARAALTAIEESSIDRLARFRDAISVVRTVIAEGGGEKPEKVDEARMLKKLQSRIRGSGLEWLSTVVADLGDRYSKPPIFGTGGNEGSGGYTAAYLGAVVETILSKNWNEHIGSALWSDGSDRDSWDGSFQPPSQLGAKKLQKENIDGPFRQFLPGDRGSPWDLLLAFEGALVIQSGVTRRSLTDQQKYLASPFYFAPLSMGNGSTSPRDEIEVQQGRSKEGRGEQWFPLWNTPATYVELRSLFREGRCSVGRRAAKQPLNAGRAICTRGAARGISSFLRYGYLQRDNLATHFAVPLGRLQVRENSMVRLVDELLGWIDHIHRLARKKNAPARLVRAERRLADALYSVLMLDLSHQHQQSRWQAILMAAADIESLQSSGTAIEAGPIPALNCEWVFAVADGSAKVRLALALGSAAAQYRERRPFDPVRHHVLPLESGGRRFNTSDKKLVKDPRVVLSGRAPIRDLGEIVERRLIEAGMEGQRRSRLVAAEGCGARLNDLAHFLNSSVDPDELLGLARAFMAIKWHKWKPELYPNQTKPADMAEETWKVETGQTPEEGWLTIRLACLPWALTKDKDIPADLRMVRLLNSGNAVRAIEIAFNRLRSVGIRPPMQAGITNAVSARRWAAALAFPIEWRTATTISELLDPRLDPKKKGLSHA